MLMKEDDSGRRRVEMEFLVPGTPEQVMQAVFFYGAEVTEVNAAEQPKWSSWLRGLLEGERIAN